MIFWSIMSDTWCFVDWCLLLQPNPVREPWYPVFCCGPFADGWRTLPGTTIETQKTKSVAKLWVSRQRKIISVDWRLAGANLHQISCKKFNELSEHENKSYPAKRQQRKRKGSRLGFNLYEYRYLLFPGSNVSWMIPCGFLEEPRRMPQETRKGSKFLVGNTEDCQNIRRPPT